MVPRAARASLSGAFGAGSGNGGGGRSRRRPRGGGRGGAREEVVAPTAMAAVPTSRPGEIARVEGELEAEGG